MALSAKKLDELFDKAEEAFKKLGDGVSRATPEELFINGDALKKTLANFSTVEWGNEAFEDIDQLFEFNTKPQPSFNKKFEMLVEDFREEY